MSIKLHARSACFGFLTLLTATHETPHNINPETSYPALKYSDKTPGYADLEPLTSFRFKQKLLKDAKPGAPIFDAKFKKDVDAYVEGAVKTINKQRKALKVDTAKFDLWFAKMRQHPLSLAKIDDITNWLFESGLAASLKDQSFTQSSEKLFIHDLKIETIIPVIKWLLQSLPAPTVTGPLTAQDRKIIKITQTILQELNTICRDKNVYFAEHSYLTVESTERIFTDTFAAKHAHMFDVDPKLRLKLAKELAIAFRKVYHLKSQIDVGSEAMDGVDDAPRGIKPADTGPQAYVQWQGNFKSKMRINQRYLSTDYPYDNEPDRNQNVFVDTVCHELEHVLQNERQSLWNIGVRNDHLAKYLELTADIDEIIETKFPQHKFKNLHRFYDVYNVPEEAEAEAMGSSRYSRLETYIYEHRHKKHANRAHTP